MTSTTSTWSGTDTPPGGRAAPGAVIGGRYALRSAIGTGGMGTVWRASDTLLRREVAMKEVVCPPGLAPSDRDAMYERTLREARAAAALSHPSVVQVYDVVMEDGRPWIVMELLDARSLADMVLEDGALATRAVAKIGIALLGALEVAHAAGVLHRDVKPANVLICVDGRCVLTDFGVARMPTDVQLTTPGMVLGSPHFISPERAMGGAFGPPSDLFSLGVTLYTAVEGHPPFDRGDPIETMHAVVEDPPAPPTRAGPLAGVIYGLLEKDPEHRWDVPRCRAVLRDLLAGPLASKARDHVTDPYAVVSTQRTPPPGLLSTPSGNIGGRAMVDPNESLEEAIARVRAAREEASASRSEVPLDATDPGAPLEAPANADRPWDMPTGTGSLWEQSAGASPPQEASASAGSAGSHWEPSPPQEEPTGSRSLWEPSSDSSRSWQVPARAESAALDETAADGPASSGPWTESATAWVRPGERPPGTTAPPTASGGPSRPGAPGSRSHRRASGRTGGAGSGSWSTTGARNTGAHSIGARHGGGHGSGGGGLAAIRGWPRWAQLAAGGGIAVVVLLAALAIANAGSGGSGPNPRPGAQPSAAASDPALNVRPFQFRGVEVNVPHEWQRVQTSSATYVEFADPDDRQRWVRINITSERNARRVLESANTTFTGGGNGCAQYQQIELIDAELGGHPGAQLEYLCTPKNGQQRHGIWRVTVVNGKAYHVYMSVWESTYADSKPIFDEMVRSFQLLT